MILFSPLSLLAYPVTDNGKAFSTFLDSLDVEHKWLPGKHVNWLTGEPDDLPGVTKSHCSTFAAGATARLDVYVLRPPEHSENLLANAQYEWLATQGKQHGWFYLKNGIDAQISANRGCMVLVAYKNPDAGRPGHIAVVRPSEKSNSELLNEGPDITQAGLENHNRSSMLEGFKHHISSAQDATLIYYGHPTMWCLGDYA